MEETLKFNSASNDRAAIETDCPARFIGKYAFPRCFPQNRPRVNAECLFVCLMLKGTSALFSLLVPRKVAIKNTENIIYEDDNIVAYMTKTTNKL